MYTQVPVQEVSSPVVYGRVPQYATQPPQGPPVNRYGHPRQWHGEFFQCCGKCDSRGWVTCLLSTLLPFIPCGKNRERAFSQSCVGWGLLFFILWAVFATTQRFTYCDLDDVDDVMPAYCDDADDDVIGLLAAVSLVALIALLALGALTRCSIRTRFGLSGDMCSDCLLWSCCPFCALCQETRTLEYNNVEKGEWYGPAPLMVTIPVNPPPVAHPHAPLPIQHPTAATSPAHRPPPPQLQPLRDEYAPSAPPAPGYPILEAQLQPKV